MKSKFFRFFIMIMCAMGISVPAAGCGFGAFGGAVSDTAVETTEESTENEDKKDSKEETTEASVVRAGEPEENKRKLDEYNAKVAAHNARVNNYHRSDVVAESFGTVNLSPAYVIYGDDGALYALMYVYNGLERPAYNIVADYIELYDLNGNLIARDENIGIGGGGAIGAKD